MFLIWRMGGFPLFRSPQREPRAVRQCAAVEDFARVDRRHACPRTNRTPRASLLRSRCAQQDCDFREERWAFYYVFVFPCFCSVRTPCAYAKTKEWVWRKIFEQATFYSSWLGLLQLETLSRRPCAGAILCDCLQVLIFDIHSWLQQGSLPDSDTSVECSTKRIHLFILRLFNSGFHAFVEMKTVEEATRALSRLHGQSLFVGCCTLSVQFSTLEKLSMPQVPDQRKAYVSLLSMAGIAPVNVPLTFKTVESGGDFLHCIAFLNGILWLS